MDGSVIPSTGIRWLDLSFWSIRKGVPYNKPLTDKPGSILPSVDRLFHRGETIDFVPEGFILVQVRPSPEQFDQFREAIREFGSHIVMKGRYSWRRHKYESWVTCEAIDVAFPDLQQAVYMKLRFNECESSADTII